MDKKRIREIASKAGGVVALSKALGRSRAAVTQWRRVPAEHVIAVEALTGVPRQELRPDLYPPEIEKRAA